MPLATFLTFVGTAWASVSLVEAGLPDYVQDSFRAPTRREGLLAFALHQLLGFRSGPRRDISHLEASNFLAFIQAFAVASSMNCPAQLPSGSQTLTSS